MDQYTSATDCRLTVIAHIRSDFPDKFGIPRQSGMIPELKATVFFTPDFRNSDTLRGLEGFSHIWLIWGFSANASAGWSPTVRPPRLGGNERRGVFATRSPFRPNPLGLSCVKLEKIELHTPDGPLLYVSGADLMDNTPIYDIKPYLPFTDSHPEALGGFAAPFSDYKLQVEFPPQLTTEIPPMQLSALCSVLAQDPRPAYQHDPHRVYGLDFAGWKIKFTVEEKLLRVTEIQKS